MLVINASQAVVYIQTGHCEFDIISKCGVGFLIHLTSQAKSVLFEKAHSSGKRS